MPYEQKERIGSLTTPLGEDVLLLRRLRGTEGISRLFRFELELVSERGDLDLGALIGQGAALRFALPDGGERFVHGLIAGFAQAGADRRFTIYRAELVPWLWLLTQRTDCRIFQEKSVPDIIADVFRKCELTDYEFLLNREYQPRTYCVQYRETDFAFVSRLLESEGIHYFFTHESGSHKLVMADAPDHNPACPGQSEAIYEAAAGGNREEDRVEQWTLHRRLRPGQYSLQSFNFEDPGLDLQVSSPSTVEPGRSDKWEIYDYPGGHGAIDPGNANVALRRERGDAEAVVVEGGGGCRAFVSGHRFDLKGHTRAEFEDTWLLVTVEHDLDQSGTLETGGKGAGAVYANRFTAVPHAVVFRPPITIPSPRMPGPQTAIVVGPEGEEIHVDEHGRVKVSFHWDREGGGGENSSCWIRVAQTWAGKKWGALFIPRIGHEVVVEFLEGSPDRPLITGSVYNGAAPPPYELPADATKSTIKSNTSKGGGKFNEIRFEDKQDEEQLFVNAAKQMDINVGEDRYETVAHDRHLTVQNDVVERVDGNRNESVGNDHMEEIGQDRHVNVAGKEAKEVGGSLSLTVGGDGHLHFRSGLNQEVAQTLSVKAMDVAIEAMSTISLKGAGGHVVIDSSGVTVEGNIVTIQGSLTNINSGSGSAPSSASAVSAVAPSPPAEAVLAGTAEPGEVVQIQRHTATTSDTEAEEKTSWIEIELVDEDDNPVPGERYRVELPDGSIAEGSLDENGFKRIEGIEPGSCKVSFPNLDEEAWEKA